ncbi:MAG TPA: hypothetical protein VN859_03625, partial [Steroidobacteraceae bacterium]|nr:hypothetical protein [Steroidobacteraceae bacterium]
MWAGGVRRSHRAGCTNSVTGAVLLLRNGTVVTGLRWIAGIAGSSARLHAKNCFVPLSCMMSAILSILPAGIRHLVLRTARASS